MGRWHANLLQEKLCVSESSQAVRASPEKAGWWQGTALDVG